MTKFTFYEEDEEEDAVSSEERSVNPVHYFSQMDAEISVQIDDRVYEDDRALEELDFQRVDPEDIEMLDDESGYQVTTRYNHLNREGSYDRIGPDVPRVGTATIKGLLEPGETEDRRVPMN